MKLKGDGRLIGKKGKRRNVKAPQLGALAWADITVALFLRSLAESTELLLSVAAATSFGTRWAWPKILPYPHGVLYSWRPCSNSPGVRVSFTRVRSPVVLACFYVSRSLWKVDTRITIVLYGCTSDPIFVIVRPWTLQSCLTAREE
jgi:hypothetical protein